MQQIKDSRRRRVVAGSALAAALEDVKVAVAALHRIAQEPAGELGTAATAVTASAVETARTAGALIAGALQGTTASANQAIVEAADAVVTTVEKAHARGAQHTENAEMLEGTIRVIEEHVERLSSYPSLLGLSQESSAAQEVLENAVNGLQL